jgi:hypothetical protein
LDTYIVKIQAMKMEQKSIRRNAIDPGKSGWIVQ